MIICSHAAGERERESVIIKFYWLGNSGTEPSIQLVISLALVAALIIQICTIRASF